MKLKTPIVWRQKPDLELIVGEVLSEATTFQVGSKSFYVPDINDEDELVSNIITQLSSKLGKSVTDVAQELKFETLLKGNPASESIKKSLERIDGEVDGPLMNSFLKRIAMMQQTDSSSYGRLTKPEAPPTPQKFEVVEPPSGTEWIMNIRGGPQPSVGKGELLFALMYGLVEGAKETADGEKLGESDLMDPTSYAQYHMKFYENDGSTIQGPTKSDIGSYYKDLTGLDGAPAKVDTLKDWVYSSVWKVLSTGTVYSTSIEKLKLPSTVEDPESPFVKAEGCLPELKAVVAWYVATAAKNSLVKRNPSSFDAEKYIVNVFGNKFRINMLNSDLTKQPYPYNRSGDGRISYSYENAGPVQIIFNTYKSLGRMDKSGVEQIIAQISKDCGAHQEQSISTGELADPEQLRNPPRDTTNWEAMFRKNLKGQSISDELKKFFGKWYLEKKNYKVKTADINPAFNWYVEEHLNSDAVQKFLNAPTLSSSTKRDHILPKLAINSASDTVEGAAAPHIWSLFKKDSPKMDAFLTALDASLADKTKLGRLKGTPQFPLHIEPLIKSVVNSEPPPKVLAVPGESTDNVDLSGHRRAGLLLSEKVGRILTVDRVLQEELTRVDKKEIEKMIRKRIEADRVEQKRIFKKNLEEELKSSKFQKILLEAVKQELGKELKGKELESVMAEVSKKVIKKLYRELSFTYQPVIDRIKI